MATYTLGHHDSVLRSHRWRTADNSAGAVPRRGGRVSAGDTPFTGDEPLVTDADTLLGGRPDTGYREFLDVPALSLGMFSATAGHVDEQQPHNRDEVYVVLAGEAVLDIAGVAHAVSAGSVAYVPAGVRHRFADVHETLRVLVFFSGERR